MGDWTLPDWAEPYMEYAGYSRKEVERLMSEPPAAVQINAPLALAQMGCEAVFRALAILKDRDLLK